MDNEISLKSLSIDEYMKIQKLTLKEPLRRRLLDLGFVPGATIKIVRKSPLGDPVAILVSDTVIALRKEECAEIHGIRVEKDEK